MRLRHTMFALLSAVLILMLLFSALENPSQVSPEQNKKKEKSYNHAARLQQEFLMLRDPATNRIPENIGQLEQDFAKGLPKVAQFLMFKGAPVMNAQALTWTERGPNNTSGRIRALGIDIRTTGTPTLLAGGASSGMWKSTDGGSTWVKKTTSAQLHSVTCIAQDTRVGSQDVWYYGTGENIGNSASGEGASYLGNGVFKSTDNGETWAQLPSTVNANPNTFENDFQYIYNIAVHPTSGNVYAATTGGIYRSTNGGTDWTKILDPGNTSTLRTDVTIASNGTVYTAASSNAGGIKGFRKSINDGGAWTDISPTLPENYGRIIVQAAPSNGDIVYFFIEGVSGTNNTPNTHNHQLWRSANGGTDWANISSVIPANTAPALDNFSTQDGYDMLLSVKPDDPNFIIVGGVSIFKIHDVTNDVMTLAQKHIGGYGIAANGTANALGDYINHHPDSHIGVFKPGSNIIFYTGNDGGVALANDITAAAGAVFWQNPLRSGLNITQFYGLSIDKSAAGSGFIAGGLQDRGNWMVRTNGALQNWQEVGGGDGAISEIEPSGTYVFQSTSKGNLFRFEKSETNSPVNTSKVDMSPAPLANALFITPFDVDDNSGDIIYFSGGTTGKNSGVWRSTNATSGTPTWSYLTMTEVASEQVSAISASKSGSANVLYYGTSGGKMFRIDNANTAAVDVAPTNISTGLPAGYVSSISVDPDNSANVLISYSNYNINRLWYTTNSGTSWTNVEGNMAGANAPSVRAVKMFTISSVPHYFIGTSTGVYFTIALNGASTTWTQEAVSSIGNVVVTGLDYRASDKMLVVATHGRGVFQTAIDAPLPVELTAFGGMYINGKVDLYWKTATEKNNYGFEIQRADGSKNWKKIAFVAGAGNSNAPKDYNYSDFNPSTSEVFYRLKQIDNDGTFEYSSEIKVNLEIPTEYALEQNYPNPFNPSTKISFSVPTAGNVTITLYDINGQVVGEIVNGLYAAGKHTVNFFGTGLSSGVYFYRITAGKFVQTRKLVLMK